MQIMGEIIKNGKLFIVWKMPLSMRQECCVIVRANLWLQISMFCYLENALQKGQTIRFFMTIRKLLRVVQEPTK